MYFSWGRFVSAIDCYERALKAVKNLNEKVIAISAHANAGLGKVYQKQKKQKKAIRYLQKAITLYTYDPGTYSVELLQLKQAIQSIGISGKGSELTS